MRPTNADQCIGRNAEANTRMREIWALNPVSGQTVFIVRAGKFEIEEWKFSWFTLAGARLFKKVDGRWYSTLLNWDKGDLLSTSKKAINVQIALNALAIRARLQVELDKYQEILEEALKGMNDES